MKDAIVELSDVCFSYHEIPVLRNITFSIHKGEFVGIIGPNGGGKTTLLKLIMGFLKPDKGTIKVFGKDPENARQHLAYVPQSLRFDRQFPISVLEVVLSGRLSKLPWYGQYSDEDYDRAKDSLEKVQMSAFVDRPFGSLSTGQAQRVLIARALTSSPSLLLLDEPTASVDPNSEAEIQAILKKLSHSMTLMMVTHNLQTIVNEVKKVICVQGEAFPLKPEEVCEHFSLGLYHPPMIKLKPGKE
jgi:zinc transport system ATP-binding protein